MEFFISLKQWTNPMCLIDCNSPQGIIYFTMEDFRKFILLVTISSFMSVGWGQSYTDDYSQEIINISDEKVMIISNHEITILNR